MKFCAIILLLLAPLNAHAEKLFEWNGIALGADASIKIYAADAASARQAFDSAFSEIKRQENIFSLYAPTSEIVQLNKQGFIKNPSPDFVKLLHFAVNVSRETNGVFDPTVQAHWRKDGDTALINYQNIIVDKRIIYFRKKGTSITLNSIAQGFITDKVAEVLQANGITNALVDLGEKYALGTHPNGRKWKILSGGKVYELENEAIATSSNLGGDYVQENHIVNPKTGATNSKAITVTAPTALEADLLATLAILQN